LGRRTIAATCTLRSVFNTLAIPSAMFEPQIAVNLAGLELRKAMTRQAFELRRQ
jgi:hypothetical protein